MPTITFRDVIYENSKSICDCLIKKGMNVEQAFEVVCKLLTTMKGGFDLSKVQIGKLGITDVDCLKNNLLTTIINALIASDASLLQSIQGFQLTLNNINQGIGLLKDEKVKVSASTDPLNVAGYLDTMITTNQPGSITITDDFKILITGFVPIGAQMMISKQRIADFDGTGKGKTGTDLWGYAISNGQNGTTNRLGKFSKYVTALGIALAGNSGGASSFKIIKANLPGFTLKVDGTIDGALIAPIQPMFKVDINKFSDGVGGSVPLVRYSTQNGVNTMTGLTLNLAHTHQFALSAIHTNESPTAIELIPEHILEIPIERITV